MHLNILSVKQNDLLSFISGFRRNFYLVGGTAIALHIGHRRSIDFDLFTSKTLNKTFIKKRIFEQKFNKIILFEDLDQIHYLINDVKITFFNYPYPVKHDEMIKRYISMPSLITLSAMKAFALSRRAKWKDYADLYFIIKDYYSINEIAAEAKNIFNNLFSEKLFREQLSFHKDIDYSEPIEYLPGFEVTEQQIKDFLINKSLEAILFN
jgi:hypothetical protein